MSITAKQPLTPTGPASHYRLSQEQESPFLIDYSQHLGPQGNNSREETMSPSSSSSSLSSSSSSTRQTGSGQHIRHDSRHGSRRSSRQRDEYPSFPAFHGVDANADTLTISKFDQYKAQMERLRAVRATALPSSTPSRPIVAHVDAKKPASLIPKLFKKVSISRKSASSDRQLQVEEEAEAEAGTSRTLVSSPSQSSLEIEIFCAPAPQISTHSQPHTRIRSRSDPEKNALAGRSRLVVSVRGYSGEDQGARTRPSMNTVATSAALATVDQSSRSLLEAQQDRWRDEWLRPSGAIYSMFRDRPSKFNCPHCGALKVVSHIQFVPGVMSYLVAFGLLFLTLGTLSYLPLRKNHEGTKDCIHWCPECDQRVARFNRANATWEWI